MAASGFFCATNDIWIGWISIRIEQSPDVLSGGNIGQKIVVSWKTVNFWLLKAQDWFFYDWKVLVRCAIIGQVKSEEVREWETVSLSNALSVVTKTISAPGIRKNIRNAWILKNTALNAIKWQSTKRRNNRCSYLQLFLCLWLPVSEFFVYHKLKQDFVINACLE